MDTTTELMATLRLPQQIIGSQQQHQVLANETSSTHHQIVPMMPVTIRRSRDATIPN